MAAAEVDTSTRPGVRGLRGHAGRQSPHRARHVRARREARDQHLDLALAPAAGHGHERVEVVGPQVRRQQPGGRQVQRTVDQQVEQRRELPAGSGDLDAVVGRVLGQTERSGAVAEERAVALAEVEPARVELGQVRDELHGNLPLGPGEEGDPAEEIGIREAGGRGVQPGACALGRFLLWIRRM
jgi:hypothetical protein